MFVRYLPRFGVGGFTIDALAVIQDVIVTLLSQRNKFLCLCGISVIDEIDMGACGRVEMIIYIIWYIIRQDIERYRVTAAIKGTGFNPPFPLMILQYRSLTCQVWKWICLQAGTWCEGVPKRLLSPAGNDIT